MRAGGDAASESRLLGNERHAVDARSDADQPPTASAGRPRPLEVLLLCDLPERAAATIFDHLDALSRTSAHHVHVLSMLGDLPAALDLGRFDAIVIHYTLVASDDRYLSPSARARIAGAPALKAIFIQDEHRFIDRTVATLAALRVDLLFTCVPPDEIEKIYPTGRLPGLRTINVLTGYVAADLARRTVPALAQRPLDVGYRARQQPPWLGDLGQEKARIGSRFLADAGAYGLRCDISYREEDRIYGEAWIAFLTRCKAMLGVESGSSVCDYAGDIQAAIERDLDRDPTLDYDRIRERHLERHHDRVRFNQISPRCFEAAALRTLMILYEGDYSGRLQAWRHYVPLRKDHGNMAEVVATLRDRRKAQDIVDRAFAEVALAEQNGYAALSDLFDRALAAAAQARAPRAAPAYSSAEFARLARPDFATRRRRVHRRLTGFLHRLVYRFVLAGVAPARRDRIQARLQRLARPLDRYLFR
jgi:hypothetical protein